MEHQHRDALAQLPLLQREVALRQREAAELEDARKRLCDLLHEHEYQKTRAANFVLLLLYLFNIFITYFFIIRLCDLSHAHEQQKTLAADFAHWEIVRKAALQEMQTLRLALEQSTNALDASNQKCRELERQLTKVQKHLDTSSHLHKLRNSRQSSSTLRTKPETLNPKPRRLASMSGQPTPDNAPALYELNPKP